MAFPRKCVVCLGETERADMLFWGGTSMLSAFFSSVDVEVHADGEVVCDLDEDVVLDF